MTCPVCRERPPRRECPALGRRICSVCCGTKRMTEIACPSGCAYLAAAQAHPAAVVRRQQERDLLVMAALTQGLTPAQGELLSIVLDTVTRFGADPLLRLHDEDVSEMAEALGKTLETAARGLIYEHRPRTLAAQRLAAEVRKVLDELEREAGVRVGRDAAAVLERMARTFGDAGRIAGESGTRVAMAAVGRTLRAAHTSARAERGESRLAAPAASRLLVP